MIEVWTRNYKPPKVLSDYDRTINKILSKHFGLKLNQKLEIDYHEEPYYNFIDIEGKTVFRKNYFISKDTFNISLVFNSKPDKYNSVFLDNFYYLAKELDFKVKLEENFYLVLNKKLSESTFFGLFIPKVKKSTHTDNFLSFEIKNYGHQKWQFSNNFSKHVEFDKKISEILNYELDLHLPHEDFRNQVSLLKITLI